MRATNIKATRGAVATKAVAVGGRACARELYTMKQCCLGSGDMTAAYTARARTLATKMMFWALAGGTFSAAKIVSRNKKKKKSWSTCDITSIVLLLVGLVYAQSLC
jgi:hypothetical protein